MLAARTLASTLSPIRTAATRLPAVRVKHARFVNTQGEELGGVQGSEPPSPQKNPVNWRAGTITAVGVLLAGAWMMRAKSKEGKS